MLNPPSLDQKEIKKLNHVILIMAYFAKFYTYIKLELYKIHDRYVDFGPSKLIFSTDFAYE